MSRKIIFGFFPPNHEDTGTEYAFAVSYEDDFKTHKCFSYEYPTEIHQMFRSWESMGVNELMESIFEYPAGKKEFVKQYLTYNGLTYSPEFEVFLG